MSAGIWRRRRGVPAERVAALRAAFDAMVRDPAYVAALKKANGDYAPLSGGELQKLVDETFAVPEAVMERARKALGC